MLRRQNIAESYSIQDCYYLDNHTMKNTNKNEKEVSRRRFIKGTAFTAAGFMIVPRHVLGGRGYVAPSDKVNIGMVGVGGRGKEKYRRTFKTG